MSENNGEKVFTQEQVNQIVSDRLAQERRKFAGIEDPAALQAELEKYRAQAAQDTLRKRMEPLMSGREFVNGYTEDAVLKEFGEALNAPENAGKADAELFDSLTKDKDGVFKSKYQPVNMGGIGHAPDRLVDPIAQAFKPKI